MTLLHSMTKHTQRQLVEEHRRQHQIEAAVSEGKGSCTSSVRYSASSMPKVDSRCPPAPAPGR